MTSTFARLNLRHLFHGLFFILQLSFSPFSGVRSFTIRLVYTLTCLDSVVCVCTNNNILSCQVKSKPVKLETSNTVILTHTVSVLCPESTYAFLRGQCYRSVSFRVFWPMIFIIRLIQSIIVGHNFVDCNYLQR